MMRLRELTAALLGSFVIGASGARSQNAPRLVAYFAPSRTQHLIDAFANGLRDLGYVDGQQVRIQYSFADADGGGIPGAAARLVAASPAVIVVVGVAAASEVKRATTAIPIVVAP